MLQVCGGFDLLLDLSSLDCFFLVELMEVNQLFYIQNDTRARNGI